MWGGLYHIEAARTFVTATLYRSRFAARNLIEVRRRLARDKVTVGVHVRLGDFSQPSSNVADYRGRFNVTLPHDWYRNIARAIHGHLGERVQFLVVSDGTRDKLKDLFEDMPIVTTSDIPDSDCSDLLALLEADLIVPSISSYSLWATSLSDAPYVWFEPHLHLSDGFYSIWGHEELQRSPLGRTRRAIEDQSRQTAQLPIRSFPVGADGVLPGELLDAVLMHFETRQGLTDLVRYGAVPAVLESRSRRSPSRNSS